MMRHFLTSLFLYTSIILAVLLLLAFARVLDPHSALIDTHTCSRIGLSDCTK